MNWDRLSLGHVLIVVGALALMFVMALDWYTNKRGEELRRIEETFEGSNLPESQRSEREARLKAENQENNAWQADRAIDRILLVVLLATVVAALFAAGARAAGRYRDPPWTPAVVVGLLALAAEILVAYRIVQEPGDDGLTEIALGPPLALGCLAVITVGSLRAMKVEEEPPPAEPVPEREPEAPDAHPAAP